MLREARAKLREALDSRGLWLTALFVTLAITPQSVSSSLYFHQIEELRLSNLDIGYLNSVSALAGMATGAAYAAVRSRFSLRSLFVAGILFGAISAGCLLFYRSWEAALAIEIVRGMLTMVGALALMEAAVRATPVSIAAMGSALLMSAWNVGVALGDYVSAWMIQHGILSFYGLAALFALLSAMTLLALPLLPRGIFVERANIDAPGGNP